MTIVVCLERDGYVALGADILFSRPRVSNSNTGLQSLQSLSPHADASRYKNEMGGYIQKIRQVGPVSYIAFAADDIHIADSVTNQLRKSSTSGEMVLADLIERDQLKSLDIINVFLDTEGNPGVLNLTSSMTRRLPDGTNCIVAGSGDVDFLDWVMRRRNAISQLNDHPRVGTLRKILDFFSHSLFQQYKTGLGLDEGWGGGFEVLLCDKGNIGSLISGRLKIMFLGKIRKDGIGLNNRVCKPSHFTMVLTSLLRHIFQERPEIHPLFNACCRYRISALLKGVSLTFTEVRSGSSLP